MKSIRLLIIFIYLLLMIVSSNASANSESKYQFVKLNLNEVYHPFLPNMDQDAWKRALLARLEIRYVATHNAVLKVDKFPIVFKDNASIIFQFPSEKMIINKPIYSVAFNYNLDDFEQFYALPIFDIHKQSWWKCDKTKIGQNSFYSYNQSNFIFSILDQCAITPIHISGSVEIQNDINAFVKNKAPYPIELVTKDNLTVQAYDILFREAINMDHTPKRITMDKRLKSWQDLIFLPDNFYTSNIVDEIANLDKRNVIISYQSSLGAFQFRQIEGLSPPSKRHENFMVKLLNTNDTRHNIGKTLDGSEQQLMHDFFAYQSGTFIKYEDQVIGYSIRTNCDRQLKSIKLNIKDPTSWKTFDTKLNPSIPYDLKEADKRPSCLNINKNLDRYKSLTSEQLEKELITLFNFIDEKRKERPIMQKRHIEI